MNTLIALHEPGREYAYPLDRFRVALRLRVPRRSVRRCRAIVWNRNLISRDKAEVFELAVYARDSVFDYCETVVETAKATRYLLYYFRIDTPQGIVWKHAHGQTAEEPEDGFYEYCYTNDGEAHQVPEWAAGAVYYQIFPDRFANGEPGRDPPGTVPWGSAPTRESVMGGDLPGIRSRLPYLRELGVDILYLNPIFASPSNHKYDTTDYLAVDPQFGTEETLTELAAECRRLGIRIVLDGVFHHCGSEFAPFRDVRANGEASAYGGWFYLDGYPVDPAALNYETIGYYWRMPKLRLSDPAARAYMLHVAVYWLERAGIDGWRLDVAEEVDFRFRQRLREAVKTARPDALLLGEAWRENRDLLRGDQMDTIMNYVFRDAVVDFVGRERIGAAAFDARLNAFLGAYPATVRNALYNPLGSHDTARFLTVCGGDLRRMKLAAAFQFCFPGCPAIYYGDEVGLDGETDPDCRKAMEWRPEKQRRELLDWYKRLTGLRREYRALREGGFVSLLCGGTEEAAESEGVYGFVRELRSAEAETGGEAVRLYAVLNRNDGCVCVWLPVAAAPGEAPFVYDLLGGGRERVRSADPRRRRWNGDLFRCRGEVELILTPYQICLFEERR